MFLAVLMAKGRVWRCGSSLPSFRSGCGVGVSFVSLNEERENKQGHRGPWWGQRAASSSLSTASSLTVGADSSRKHSHPGSWLADFGPGQKRFLHRTFWVFRPPLLVPRQGPCPKGLRLPWEQEQVVGYLSLEHQLVGGRGSARTLGGPHTRGGEAVLGGQREQQG